MDRSREHTAAFTGHRRYDGECDDALRAVVRELYGWGFRVFWSGMALGFDLAAAEAVLALRERRPDVTLEAAIPCEEQDRRWTHGLSERYDRLLAECDSRTLVSRAYTPECMMRRNRYMVDNAGTVLAVFNGSPGGTFNTLRYAVGLGRKIVEIEP